MLQDLGDVKMCNSDNDNDNNTIRFKINVNINSVMFFNRLMFFVPFSAPFLVTRKKHSL